ncbi:MAG: hypothetical protein WCN92_01465, partial [Eubacteriales bacterium]
QKDVEAVLLELGKPAELGAKYRGSKNYLIGPDYFGTYTTVLKIVLAAVAGGLTIALIVVFFTEDREHILKSCLNFLSDMISALFQAFGWVTVIFALMQRFNAKIDEDNKDWNPKELPEVPAEKARIKKGEPIAGIIFTVIVLILLNSAPNLLGIYNFSGNMAFIPFFDLTVFKSMLPLIDVLLGLSILKEVFRLVFEKYNLKLAAAVTLINVCSVLLIVYIFLPPDIWNAHFVESIRAAEGFMQPVDVDLDYVWRNIPIWFVGLSLFGNAVDTITTIAKSVRYSFAK